MIHQTHTLGFFPVQNHYYYVLGADRTHRDLKALSYEYYEQMSMGMEYY